MWVGPIAGSGPKAGLELEGRADLSVAGLVKKELQKSGHKALVEYIKFGEEQEFHKRENLGSRKIWFDQGELKAPPLLFPVEYWKENYVFINRDSVFVDKHLISVTPKKGVDSDVLAGVLNSSLNALFREIHGRVASGEALARNEMWINDAKKLPVPDLRKLEASEKDRIRRALIRLKEGDRTSTKEELAQMYVDLDRAVMAALGMEERVDELRVAVEELLQRRIRGAGAVRGAVVEREGEETPKIIKIKGAEVISSPSSLDSFIK